MFVFFTNLCFYIYEQTNSRCLFLKRHRNKRKRGSEQLVSKDGQVMATIKREKDVREIINFSIHIYHFICLCNGYQYDDMLLMGEVKRECHEGGLPERGESGGRRGLTP
jgi:hypothetical protein